MKPTSPSPCYQCLPDRSEQDQPDVILRPTRPIAIDGCSGGDRRSRAQKLHHVRAIPRAHPTPLAALRHFADHCPALAQLGTTKLAIPDALDIPPARAWARAEVSGLEDDVRAELRRGRLEKAIIAPYIDWLSSNLVLSERETAWLATKQMLVVFT